MHAPKYIFLLLLSLTLSTFAQQEKTPAGIVNPQLLGFTPKPAEPWFGISRAQLYPTAISGADSAGRGLVIDLQDSSLSGKIYSGVFYFERGHSDYYYPRYREISSLRHGKGVIRIKDFIRPGSETNVNHWKDEGTVAYRLDLWKNSGGNFRSYGFHDAAVRFLYRNGKFRKALSLTEGPIVNLINSDHPDRLVISFETDRPSRAWIELKEGGLFTDSTETIRHEIRVSGLQPARNYSYRVAAVHETDTLRSPQFTIRTAPRAGESGVVFAYTGDGRAGIGGGERQYLGVNRYTLSQIGADIFRRGAQFMLFGGDMVNGYTDYAEDFLLEFKAFKQSLFGYLVQRPLYTAVGNHESLLNRFKDPDNRWGLQMDKWPYRTSSVEATFAREFVHPQNGPVPYPGTPPYRETVYSFTYGDVKIIVFNNNYWWTSHNRIPDVGGSPEGYILPNQMEWIREEVRKGDENPAIRYILLMAQEAVFPNGGHVSDAMWYNGNNRMRAAIAKDSATVEEFSKGIVEVRNEFWEIVSGSRKVAAVLGSDEHAYHRTLITDQTPVGIYPQDDLDGNGKLDDGRFSADPAFEHPAWYIVSGGAGAPYYVQEKTPWQNWVKTYSSHYNYLILKSYPDRISLEVYNLTGQLLDREENLMTVKKKENPAPFRNSGK